MPFSVGVEPFVPGDHGGQRYVEVPEGAAAAVGTVGSAGSVDDAAAGLVGADAAGSDSEPLQSQHDEFDTPELGLDWNTLRVPFGPEIGTTGDGSLTLYGQGSLSNLFELSLVARRWQAFNFDAETKVTFEPSNYQQMAGLVNYYNDQNWSWVFVTRDEERGRVIEVAQNDRNAYTSFLRDAAIRIPDSASAVWFRTKVRTQYYTYEYSFDGAVWEEVPVKLDAKILSDDYVEQTYGGYFTGAFVGLAAVDYAGYRTPATFDYFDYAELPEE